MAGPAVGVSLQNIINEALGHLGVYQGDPLQAPDLQTAFFTLQAMLDGWQLEPGSFRQVAVESFTTQAGKSSYLVGPSALNPSPAPDWVTPFLPMQFDPGSITNFVGTVEIPVGIDARADWEAIALKTMQSSILTDCWPQFGLTAVTLNFWPVPNTSIAVNLYLPQQLSTPAAATATVILPPGYQEAMTFELAIKCSSKFGAALPAWLPEAWREAKEKIRAANWEPLAQRCDAALLGRRGSGHSGGGSIAFYTGE